MINPKKNIKNLVRIYENQSISRYGKIRLDRNERTISFKKKIISEIKESITDEMLMTYPEPEVLYNKMSLFLGISKENLLFNSGSDLCIKSIFETYIESNDKVLFHEPSYAMYDVYAKMFGAKIIRHNFEKTFKLNFDTFGKNLTKSLKLVVLENPNGFLGVEHKEFEIVKLLEKAKKFNILVIIDEAYHDFIDTKMHRYIKKYDNLIIVRTFSKAFGLASARVGYILSSEKNINNIKKVKPMHELSQFAINASIVLLNNLNILNENIIKTKNMLGYFKNELKKLNIKHSKSVTNFLVAKLDISDEEAFLEELGKESILIRRKFKQKFLHGFRRIGVSEKHDINKIISLIKEFK